MDWSIHCSREAWPTHLPSAITWWEDSQPSCQWPRSQTLLPVSRGCTLCYVDSLITTSCLFSLLYYSYSFLFCLFNIMLFFILSISASLYWVLASKWVCGWDPKSIVTLQYLVSPAFFFSMLGDNLLLMKSWWKIWSVWKGKSRPIMNLCAHWGTPCMYSAFCSMCSSSSN